LTTDKEMSMRERPRILLVADSPTWAWAYMQRWIVKTLADRYDFYTDFLSYHLWPVPRGLRRRLGLCRYKWQNRKDVRRLPDGEEYDVVVYLGFYFSFYGRFDYRAKKIIKGIYNDGFPPAGTLPADAGINMESFRAKYFADADAVLCGSQLIWERYARVLPNCHYATAGHDPDLFQRTRPLRPNEGKRFVVGWTGKPERAFKGFYDFVVPAVEAAQQKRPGIELKTRFGGPLHTLPRFYDDVDVVLIASDADAGPSLFCEACACQVPSISTRIGLPYELIQHGRNGLFVERDVGQMAEAVVHLYDHRDLLFSMARRIREDWLRSTREHPAQWIRVFDSVLQSKPS
jgi:glycosyltransferase involved in cell wall biosynthesis